MPLTGPEILPNNGTVKSAVILLHGLGANGDNLIDIGRVMQKNFPDTVFIAPNAPFDFEMMPGYGYQWFSLQNWSPKSMLDGANSAAPILNDFIDEATYNHDCSLSSATCEMA